MDAAPAGQQTQDAIEFATNQEIDNLKFKRASPDALCSAVSRATVVAPRALQLPPPMPAASMRFGRGFSFLRLFDHLVRRVVRHFLVMAEFLGMDAATAGQRAQDA